VTDPTFTLKLHVSGLGLFVEREDEESGKRQMHILFPDSRGSAHHQQHYAKIYFEDKYAATAATKSPVEIDGLRWSLPPSSTPGLSSAPDDVLINLSNLAPKDLKLPPGQIKHGNQMHVSSHVVIPDGKYICHGDRAPFSIRMHPDTVTMTNRILWEIPNIRSSALTLSFRRLRQYPQAAVPTVELKPVDRVIELHLLHAPIDEHQGKPGMNKCEKSKHTHFDMLRVLFGGGEPRTAHCIGDATISSCPKPPLPEIKDSARKRGEPRGTRVYTCMLAGAELE
jgi:hypothetical protein